MGTIFLLINHIQVEEMGRLYSSRGRKGKETLHSWVFGCASPLSLLHGESCEQKALLARAQGHGMGLSCGVNNWGRTPESRTSWRPLDTVCSSLLPGPGSECQLC